MKRQRPGTGGYAGFELNRRDGEQLAHLVGKLIVNCGGVELLTFLWIRELATDIVLFDLAIDLPLNRRIELILALAEERKIEGNLLQRVRTSWKEVAQLAQVRNIVAHGPIAFGWNGPELPGHPPDFLGTPVLREMKRNKTGKVRIAKIDGLEVVVNRSAEIAAGLSQLLDEVIKDVEGRVDTDPDAA